MTIERFCVHSPSYALRLAAILVLFLVGCAIGPEPVPTYDFDEDRPETQQFLEWIVGEKPELDLQGQPSAQALFLAGEMGYWDGDLEEAYRRYVEMLQLHPGHVLNRYAAFRLYRLRGQIIDYPERIAADLEDLRFEDETALTRLELARIAHEVEFRRWRRDGDAEPFRLHTVGMIDRWRATPNLSPWRLLAFDEVFSPESDQRLADRYRSPAFALPDEAHEQHSSVIAVERPRERLGLGGSGIHYLEGWLEIEGADPREITLFAQFPGAARVWVDGVQVVEHGEPDYEPGRWARSMILEPGTYRVLVKMAYRAGSRDWAELLWVPRDATFLGDSGIGSDLDGRSSSGEVLLLGDQRRAMDLEPLQLGADQIESASAPALYAAAVSAYASGDNRAFRASWEPLMERHPQFVAGHILGSYQVRTRWDVPSDLRDARAISRMRQAQQIAPQNLHVLVQLERLLRDQGDEREYRRILERARDLALRDGGPSEMGAPETDRRQADEADGGRGDQGAKPTVRQRRPLVAWARYLELQGWSEEAEGAWRQVLDVDPGNCYAARRLQGLYRARNYFPALHDLTPRWESCSGIVSRWLQDHPDRLEEQVAFAERQAKRRPYDASRQTRWADALRSLGDTTRAAAVLDEALERMPESSRLWDARIDIARLEGDEVQVAALLDRAIEKSGRTAAREWERARLEDRVPLDEFLRDGRQAALEEVRRSGLHDEVDEGDAEDRAMVLDDAYFVIDFAARRYFDDGSSWVLTHQLVRAMTRGAIDRYAELTVPRDAHLLVARTIKEDGQVRVPEGVSGDSTLSMPGLAPGDMVEVAYLQFRPAAAIARHHRGNRFYFRMAGVSSRLSEYVVLGADGFAFEGANGAPEVEEFQWQGQRALRFVATDSRRPRTERRRVNPSEYLPWVREYRVGVDGDVLDVERRYMWETLVGSTRRSPEVDRAIATWLGRDFPAATADDDDVRRLFYGATDWFRSPSPGRFSVDAAHALQRRRGSPLVVLMIALRKLGVDHDVYLGRSDENPPAEDPVGEIDRYRHALLRVVMPQTGEVEWLQLDRRDAMFGAVEPELVGQPALCVTCDGLRREEVVVDEQRRPSRHVELDGQLDEEGSLRGHLHYEFRGRRAVRVRSALRGRTDEDDRRSYFERVLTGQIAGADLMGYEIDGEQKPDDPLRFSIAFERPDFARVVEGQLVIDQILFDEAMQQIYAQAPSRTTPMFVGYQRDQSYSVRIGLPAHGQARVGATDVGEDGQSSFGNFRRSTWVEDDILRIESAIELPRQRIQPGDYQDFRQWATTVENSGKFFVRIEL